MANKQAPLLNVIPNFQFSQQQRIQYPSHDKYFTPEELNSNVLDIPKMDKKLINQVFDTDLLKPVEQRAAYMKVTKHGKTYHIFDASKIPLGRMCQQISIYIRGKHKPTYKPNKNELGDQCIVVNAGDILMTGKKALKKQIFYHTGYVGNLKVKNYSEYLLEKPEQLIIWIISKQLPKNLLRRDLLKKVDIFRGAEHNMLDKFPNFIPKQATFDFLKEQAPEKLALNKNIQITYSSSEELPAEFSHLQYEKNNEIEVPFKERNQILKMTPHNRQVIKEWRKFFHQRKRYQVHKPKAPKSKQPKIHEQDLYIKSKAQIAKYGLQDKVYPEDSQEIDDETSKAKFF